MDSTTTTTNNTGFQVEKSSSGRQASSSGALSSYKTALSSPSFLIKKSLRPMKAKLLGVNANSNDEQQQAEEQQEHANKKTNGKVGQKRTGANSTSNDCSGRAGTSNDGSSIHTTTKTTTTDYQQLQDERTDDLDPIEQWRKQQHYLEKKQQEPQHIIKEVCLFLKNRSWKKKLMTFIAIVSVIPIVLDIFILQSGHLRSFFTTYLEWMTDHRLLGSLAYVFILVLTSLIFIPPSILIFAAGFTFTSLFGKIGILMALLTSYVGCTIGGVIGFVRARYMTRDLIEILMRRYPTIHAVDKAIVRNSLRVMILMRLNCLIPFGVLNYVFGITGVPWDTFVISMVGVLPWQLFLICLGASSATVYDTNSGEEEDEGVHLIRILLSSMGVAFGFIGLAITWKFAKKELQREVLDPATADATWNNIDSGGDLHATDYLRSMYFGDDQSYRSDNAIEVLQQQRNGIVQVGDYLHTNEAWVDDMRVSSYQQKLTWNEIMLDDFS